MTGEEAKKEIIDMANALQLIPNTPKGKAVSMALKALEQEPVLDKIRAEIDKIYEREGSSFDCLNALDELKEFIDKQMTESERIDADSN